MAAVAKQRKGRELNGSRKCSAASAVMLHACASKQRTTTGSPAASVQVHCCGGDSHSSLGTGRCTLLLLPPPPLPTAADADTPGAAGTVV